MRSISPLPAILGSPRRAGDPDVRDQPPEERNDRKEVRDGKGRAVSGSLPYLDDDEEYEEYFHDQRPPSPPPNPMQSYNTSGPSTSSLLPQTQVI